MSDKPTAPPERFSLSRWSRRKLEPEASGSAVPAVPAPATPAVAVSAPPAAAPELPSIDSLGFDSDFTAFLRPGTDEKLKRAALRQLFRDPRFNLMDGLDTYIDDYTKADPIPPDMLKDLLQRMSAVSARSDLPKDEQPPQGEQRTEDPAVTEQSSAVALEAPKAAESPPADEAAPAKPAAPSSTS